MKKSLSSDQISIESSFVSASTEYGKVSKNIMDLQTEIINQGKEIEDFINLHGKKKGQSKSFIALQTLFKSFKAELSLNITLRKTLIEERENYQKNIRTLTKEVVMQNKFFEQVSHLYGTNFTSFEQIYNQIKETLRESKLSKIYVNQIKEITQQNQESEAQLSLDMAHLHACLEKSDESKAELENKLHYTTLALNSKDQTISMLTDQLRTLQSKQNEIEKNLKQSEERREVCENLLQQAEVTLKTATNKAKQYRNERNQLSGYLESIGDIDKRQKEIVNMLQNRRQVPIPVQIPLYNFDESESDDIYRYMRSLQDDINNLKQDIANFNE